MAQPALAPAWSRDTIQSVVLTRRRDFDALFEGFADLRAVAYVTSASLLLDLLENRGFRRVELVVGESVTSQKLKDELTHTDRPIVDRIASEVESGNLRILVPKRTIHSKFYLLGNGEFSRLIVTSANLTETARRGTAQTNYAWYVDVPAGHPMLIRAERDYQQHCESTTLFMGDLVQLLTKRQDLARGEVISIWLGTESGDPDLAEAKAVIQELVADALAYPGDEERPVIHFELPKAPESRRQTLKLLTPFGVDGRAAETRITPGSVIRYVEEAHGVPLLRVDVPEQEVWLGFRGAITRLDEDVGPPLEVDHALADLEAYIDTVDFGQSLDSHFAKTSMYEAALYALAAPFAHEQMKERRHRYGSVNRRGPRFLYVYGPAQNGKTTFLRYVLKLITGSLVDPLTSSRFTKPNIRGVQILGTSFPLMFDDMAATATKTFEDLIKSHWETEWNEALAFPQIIFTSNHLNLRDWAKSRLKRVDFDVHFVPTTRTQEHLATILDRPNPLFRWFARLCLQRIAQPGWLTDDEMAVARDVMLSLYQLAGRDLPLYFPRRPLEELYDSDLRAWKDLIRQRKAAVHRAGNETRVVFSDDLEPQEIQEYRACMPQTVKARKIGKTLVIENPQQFHTWLEGPTTRSRWWEKVFRKRR
jgi:hypothetical protein